MSDETEVEQEVIRLLEGSRKWGGFWTGGERGDKPGIERLAVRTILEQVGFRVSKLTSVPQGEDPPDCEAEFDKQFCGIEVTELVDERTLKKSIRSLSKYPDGSKGCYREWQRADLLEILRDLVKRKDVQCRRGPYIKRIVVIVSDEFFLTSEVVREYLKGATFSTHWVTDALLGLSYEPTSSLADEEGIYPVFKLL